MRKYNPTSPGVRGKTSLTFDDITASEPYRPLTETLHRSGGRNNRGELTSWWRGGGHKRLYRVIDFKRDKKDIPAKVSTVEYDPNRSRCSLTPTARSATSCSRSVSKSATRCSPATTSISCRATACR